MPRRQCSFSLRLGNFIFFEKLKIVEKNLHELNCSYGKVSHTHEIKFQFSLEI